jgi:hypothetical protein
MIDHTRVLFVGLAVVAAIFADLLRSSVTSGPSRDGSPFPESD